MKVKYKQCGMNPKYLKYYYFAIVILIFPRLKSLLKELPFYDELNITKNNSAFNDHAQSYNVELIDKKRCNYKLKTSKISIKNLFKDLLMEMKGFKYQITLQVLLSKVKSSVLSNIQQSI